MSGYNVCHAPFTYLCRDKCRPMLLLEYIIHNLEYTYDILVATATYRDIFFKAHNLYRGSTSLPLVEE